MSISLACRLALAAGGANYELVQINSLAGETRQANFLAINPLGQIPVLECDGVMLSQAVAILTYIAEHAGQQRGHGSALDRARALSIMLLASVEVQPNWTMNNRPERFVDGEAARSEVVRHAVERLEKAYVEVDRQLGLLGDARELGILDYYLCVYALWKVMVPVAAGFAATPHLDALKDRVMAEPRLRQVIDEDIASYTALAAQSGSH